MANSLPKMVKFKIEIKELWLNSYRDGNIYFTRDPKILKSAQIMGKRYSVAPGMCLVFDVVY